MAGESVGIRYVGGPADGTGQYVMVGSDGMPPTSVNIFTPPPPLDRPSRPSDPVGILHRYVRQMQSVKDTTPWTYVYEEAR